jgi:hypothetical protein
LPPFTVGQKRRSNATFFLAPNLISTQGVLHHAVGTLRAHGWYNTCNMAF